MGINLTPILSVIYFASFIFILIASIKLFKSNHIPGSKLIFIAVIGLIIVSIASILTSELLFGDVRLIYEMVINLTESLLLLVGAYGFWCFVNYYTKINTKKIAKMESLKL